MRDKRSPGQSTLYTGECDGFTSIVHYKYIGITLPDRVDLLHRHLALSQLQNMFVDYVDECPHTCINITSSSLRYSISLKTDVQRFPLPLGGNKANTLNTENIVYIA